MNKRKTIKVDVEMHTNAKGALNVFIHELASAAFSIERTTGPSDKSREMYADVEILQMILDTFNESEEVDQDPPGILESAKRPSQMN